MFFDPNTYSFRVKRTNELWWQFDKNYRLKQKDPIIRRNFYRRFQRNPSMLYRIVLRRFLAKKISSIFEIFYELKKKKKKKKIGKKIH